MADASDQIEIVRGLRDALTTAEAGVPQLVQTHLSYVLLAGRRVFKIKKAIDLGFADFRSLAVRREMCERELVLNRRLAPAVYVDVHPITRQGSRFGLGGVGRPVEYALEMRYLDPAGSLESRVRAGTATTTDLARIAARLWAFHAANGPTRSFRWLGSRQALLHNHLENARQLRPFVGDTIAERELRVIRTGAAQFLRHRRSLIASRIAQGWIRDCHGDVRCEHVYLDGDVTIIDCIEFADRFRYSDVAAEIAFLAVDLESLGRDDLATTFVESYQAASGDGGLREVLPYYCVYRATVRLKVQSMLAADEQAGAERRASARAAARRFATIAVRHASACS